MKPYVVSLGVALFILVCTVTVFAFLNGSIATRSRAATVTKYLCMLNGECTGIGTVVSSVYCGTTCRSPNQCCQTTSIVNTPTKAPAVPYCSSSCVCGCSTLSTSGGTCKSCCNAAHGGTTAASSKCPCGCTASTSGGKCKACPINTPTPILYPLRSDWNDTTPTMNCSDLCKAFAIGLGGYPPTTGTCLSAGLNSSANDGNYETVENGACVTNLLTGCGFPLSLDHSCPIYGREFTYCLCKLSR